LVPESEVIAENGLHSIHSMGGGLIVLAREMGNSTETYLFEEVFG